MSGVSVIDIAGQGCRAGVMWHGPLVASRTPPYGDIAMLMSPGNVIGYMKTMIELNDEALARGQRPLA
jgi:hypothetical protein